MYCNLKVWFLYLHPFLKLLNYNKYLIAVYTMTIDINGLIGNLPISVAQKINYDYFLRVKNKLSLKNLRQIC